MSDDTRRHVDAILLRMLERDASPRLRIVEPDPIGDSIRRLAESKGISPAVLRQAIRDRLERPDE